MEGDLAEGGITSHLGAVQLQDKREKKTGIKVTQKKPGTEENKGDRDELITDTTSSNSAYGQGGHVTKSDSPSSNGSQKNETSPLHKAKDILKSGKEITQSRGLKFIIASAVSFSLVITVALVLSIYFGHSQVGTSGAVASDVGVCSEMGLTILKTGGNAVDAAVTTMLCAGVVDAQSSGIGGGGFMLVHDHKNFKSEVFDFREVAPSGASKDVYNGNVELAKRGGMAVGVPGELRGMEAAHKKYGKLSWKEVVQPAEKLARDGFKITKSMGEVFKSKNKVDINEFKGNLAKYYTKDGGFVAEGTLIKRPDLADTLQVIADNGADAFYDGPLSDGIISSINANLPQGVTSWMTRDDLRNYKVEVRESVTTTYHEKTIESVPAPGSGPVILSIMNMLEGYNLNSADANKTEIYHRMIEAFKFAYAQQQSLGDPAFNTEIVKNATLLMLDKMVATKHRNMTTNMTHSDPSFYEASSFATFDRGTSHISVTDAQELMVSVTSTINYWFGSLVMTDSGILLNDQMADFTIPNIPGSTEPDNKINYIEKGKRPQSNMAPTMLYQKDLPCALRLNLGASNGSRIPTGIVQVLLNVVAFGQNLTAAIQAPRIHSQLYPDVVEFEEGIKEQIYNEMKQRGHTVQRVVEGINIVQGIEKIRDSLEAFSDPRKFGKAAQFLT